MKRLSAPHSPKIFFTFGLLFLLKAPWPLLAEPSPSSVSAFNAYTRAVESRLAHQHLSQSSFLVIPASESQTPRLRAGVVIVERVIEPQTPSAGDFSGALLHHWRATAFAKGARAADFKKLLQNYNKYPQVFAPQVLRASAIETGPERLQASMRIRQQHVIPVVMDMTYNIAFGQLDRQHGYSVSQSTHVAEIDSPGTSAERPLAPNKEHGYLWRLNTYWSYEERDGGLYLQIETVSLTRSIPAGLGWAIRPYVESIPRESMEFTLRSACNSVRK